MRSTGDFIVRSNEVESVCRRIDPDDYDDDGWQNDDDGDPYCWDESWDDFWQELPEGANTNDPGCGWCEGALVWSVPCGWHVGGTHGTEAPIGRFVSGATQIMRVNTSGDCMVRKHSQIVKRLINGRVYLNGRLVE